MSIMLVKVFIKRQIIEGKEMDVFALLKKLRFKAMNQEGYISGETLISPDDPRKILVISTWQGREKWNDWKKNEDRKKIDAQLEEMQIDPTLYEPFVFSKYWISVQKGFPDFPG